MGDIRDKTIREVYEGAGEEKGRIITWKGIAVISVASLMMLGGLIGAGRFMFLVPTESMDLRLGWICIGVVALGGLLLMVGFPLYMRGGSKRGKEDKAK